MYYGIAGDEKGRSAAMRATTLVWWFTNRRTQHLLTALGFTAAPLMVPTAAALREAQKALE